MLLRWRSIAPEAKTSPLLAPWLPKHVRSASGDRELGAELASYFGLQPSRPDHRELSSGAQASQHRELADARKPGLKEKPAASSVA